VIAKLRLAQALDHALSGKWQEAHKIVQQDEQEELSCWIHAVLHRQEGDMPNAQYWYARCGRQLRTSISAEEELRQIRLALPS
jgi:hypothetical protein